MWRTSARLSTKQLTALVNALLPPADRVSWSTINRYEHNTLPAEGAKVQVLAAIAIACGRQLRELPDDVRAEISMLGALLNSKYCTEEVQRAA